MKKERIYNYQKRAYKAYLLQWVGTNLGAVSAELRELGYDSFEIERGTIMARGKGMSLLCIHQGNWLRFGQNGSFKVMRPDEQETYVPIQSDDELRAEITALRVELDVRNSHIRHLNDRFYNEIVSIRVQLEETLLLASKKLMPTPILIKNPRGCGFFDQCPLHDCDGCTDHIAGVQKGGA